MVENDNGADPSADKAKPGGTAPSEDGRVGRVAAPGTDVQAYIGRQLRAVYDDVAKQPIPDRFLALMKQLESKGAN